MGILCEAAEYYFVVFINLCGRLYAIRIAVKRIIPGRIAGDVVNSICSASELRERMACMRIKVCKFGLWTLTS